MLFDGTGCEVSHAVTALTSLGESVFAVAREAGLHALGHRFLRERWFCLRMCGSGYEYRCNGDRQWAAMNRGETAPTD